MPQLFDGKYSSEDLRQMTGSMAQIAGIRLSELDDGKPRGLRVADIYTGSGFRFQVLLDRAMDIKKMLNRSPLGVVRFSSRT